MMEAGQRERGRGSTTCLVCGRQGGNTVLVTSVHSFVSASGTPLSDFLVKVVGEDPCYSVSEVICQQCFVLLDRLDAYQARAAEIHTHVTSRYRDTKLELLGQRQKMSELIASSLSNVQELRHGTTLNVSDELTITIVHEAMPKRRGHYRLQNGEPLGHMKLSKNIHGTSKSLNGRNNPLSQYISPKFKRKRGPELGLELPYDGKKKRKLTLSANGALSNNNNISYNKSVKGLGLLAVAQDYTKFKYPKKVSSGEEDLSEDESRLKADHSDEEKEEDEQGEEESSDDGSSSESDDDDSSSADEGEDTPKKTENSEKALKNDDDEEDEDDNQRQSGDECETPSKRPASSLSQISADQESQFDTKSSREDLTQAQRQLQEQQLNAQLQAENQTVPPHVAEAMLMQSPLATSLLQSFLATSLWFGSPDNPKKKSGSQAKQKQQQQDTDDVTRETLAVAAGSTKDKKKRQELKNTGQSYVNTKGKLVDAKRVWPQDCSRCPLKCNARISEDDRLRIFAEYWGLADYNLQRNYLAAHMQREEKFGPSGLPRTVILYFLSQDKNTKLQVCRQFFLKTLDVSEKASRIVLEKMVRGELGLATDGGTPLSGSRPHSSPEDIKKENEGEYDDIKKESEGDYDDDIKKENEGEYDDEVDVKSEDVDIKSEDSS